MTEWGPLQHIYLQVHPDATTGLDVCALFEANPNVPFTQAEIQKRLGCGHRIIREWVPAALNADRTRIVVDRSARPMTYTYVPDA